MTDNTVIPVAASIPVVGIDTWPVDDGIRSFLSRGELVDVV